MGLELRQVGFETHMCGIAGFMGPWSDRLLGAMLTQIAQRGPDGRGLWRDPDFQLALGHVRLSIIDLSASANQPMLSQSGRYAITFNGEIYNYRALRSDLEALGVRFRTASDTEVLLHLLIREGAECLQRLQGIFAFAFWDRQKRRLLLARDQLGVKPLYYAQLARGILFSSELKAIVSCPDVPRHLDADAALSYLAFLWSPSEATMLRAVRKLRPGHYAVVDHECRVRVQRYYTVPMPAKSDSVSSAQLAATLDEIVRDQIVADVPVGAFLSGGLDSSAVVASMCRSIEPSRLVTFCGTVAKRSEHGDNFGDDIRYAREVARRLGVPLVEVATDGDLVDELPGMLWQLDEPTADFSALQTHKIAVEARRRGVKVLLSGTGGDDLFTGYGRHTAVYCWAMLNSIPGARTLASSVLRGAGWKSLLGRRLARLGLLLRSDEEEMLTEAMSFSTLPKRERGELLADSRRLAFDSAEPLLPLLERSRGLHPVDRMLQLDLHGFVPDLNLNYADKMAMAAGVEVRVPLLDPRMVAFAMKVPLHEKISLRGTKRCFRRAMRDRLPASVLTRPKQGFGVPVRAWLAGAGRNLVDEVTDPDRLLKRGLFDPKSVARLRSAFDGRAGDVGFSLFTVIAIELWCDQLDAHPAMKSAEARAPETMVH